MEYEETFEVKGRYGTHTGPAIRIARIVKDYEEIAKEKGYNLEIEFIKTHCPLGRNIGEKIDPFLVVNTLSLFLIEESKIKVIASLDQEQDNEKNLLRTAVRDIGKIIQNVDNYTFRQH